MDLKGKEYAKVPERIKEFRQDCPNGSIKTTPTMLADGQIMFQAVILKDKSNANSADATAHAIGKSEGEKAFEKLETIAVGRALAMLGYLSSGEVASSEEMEEFQAHQDAKKLEKRLQAIESLRQSTTLDELKARFLACGPLMADPEVISEKDSMKKVLSV